VSAARRHAGGHHACDYRGLVPGCCTRSWSPTTLGQIVLGYYLDAAQQNDADIATQAGAEISKESDGDE
jgi:hypothetical protein